MSAKSCLIWGAVFGLLTVVLGALGAHGLESAVENWDLAPEEKAKRLANWETAVRYLVYHAFALLALGAISAGKPGASASVAAWSFVIGVLLFSGCLFAWVMTGVAFLVHIVPIGGGMLIVGWAAMLAFIIRRNQF